MQAKTKPFNTLVWESFLLNVVSDDSWISYQKIKLAINLTPTTVNQSLRRANIFKFLSIYLQESCDKLSIKRLIQARLTIALWIKFDKTTKIYDNSIANWLHFTVIISYFNLYIFAEVFPFAYNLYLIEVLYCRTLRAVLFIELLYK